MVSVFRNIWISINTFRETNVIVVCHKTISPVTFFPILELSFFLSLWVSDSRRKYNVGDGSLIYNDAESGHVLKKFEKIT